MAFVIGSFGLRRALNRESSDLPSDAPPSGYAPSHLQERGNSFGEQLNPMASFLGLVSETSGRGPIAWCIQSDHPILWFGW